MTISEAIELLNDCLSEADKMLYPEWENAINLGIEALKAWKKFRGEGRLIAPHYQILLPGETMKQEEKGDSMRQQGERDSEWMK